jgi:hypothetical protein
MELRAKGKLLRNVALVGLVLLLIGSLLLPGSRALYVALPAFALIVIGLLGLFVLSNQERSRPIPKGTGASAAALPSLARAPVAAGPPSAGSPNLSNNVRFDLSLEFQRRRAQMRFWVVFSLGAAAVFVALGALEVGIGLASARATPLWLGVLLLVMAAYMFTRFRRAFRGVAGISVGPDGIGFELVPPTPALLRWDDPRFGLRLVETSADVNRATDPAKDLPTYWLSTGPGSRSSSGGPIFTDIPSDCFELLLRQARAHGLEVVPGTEGVVGTLSERRTYRVRRKSLRFVEPGPPGGPATAGTAKGPR